MRTLTWTHCIPAVDAWWEGGLSELVRASAGVLGPVPGDAAEDPRGILSGWPRPIAPATALAVPSVAKIAAGCRP